MPNDIGAPTTMGVWIGADDAEMVASFDEYFETHGQGTYSRSARIKEAMAVYMAAHDEVRQDGDLPDPDSMRIQDFARMVRSEIQLDDAEKVS